MKAEMVVLYLIYREKDNIFKMRSIGGIFGRRKMISREEK